MEDLVRYSAVFRLGRRSIARLRYFDDLSLKFLRSQMACQLEVLSMSTESLGNVTSWNFNTSTKEAAILLTIQ